MAVNLDAPREMWPHIHQVLEGEYDVPLEIEAPLILDIGANIGAFTVWAAARWPSATIHAYEPIRENFAVLEKNVEANQSRMNAKILLHNVAVLGGDLTRRRMHLGKNNCGECSFYDLGEQTSKLRKVKTVDARALPAAHIIKVDAEGCELEILEELDLSKARAVMLEVHRRRDLPPILNILRGFTLIVCHQMMLERWIVKVVRQ